MSKHFEHRHMQAIGDELRSLRDSRGTDYIAFDAGVDVARLERVMSGKAMPTIPQLYALCAVLNVPVTDVLLAAERRLEAV